MTGAGEGLGLEIARALAQAGAHVLVNGRTPEKLKTAVASIVADGVTAEAYAFDITDEAGLDRFFETVRQRHGRLDILVNNVGMRDRRPLDAFTLDDVRALLEVNLVAAFELARRAARLMEETGGGRIINITSIAGPIAGRQDTVYTASKGGLEALTRALSSELGRKGINVNAIAPGFFATERNRQMQDDLSITAWLEQRTALARWGEPPEIAGAAVFLASPAASYITGQVMTVDGGLRSHF